MEILLTIKDKDIAKKDTDFEIDQLYNRPKLREAARVVIFDPEDRIALLFVSRLNYYKLPGGGIDKGETKMAALVRECLEETGCYIEAIKELGMVVEYKERIPQEQRSYCYIAKLQGDKGEPSFEQGEIDDGFELLWTGIDEAIELIKNTETNSYLGNFIIQRELAILNKAKELIANEG